MTTAHNILKVDLSTAAISTAPLPMSTIQRYIGGRGFNVGYLHAHLPMDVDPLGPENILMISAGLLTGTEAPSSSRVHISARSPQTGLIGNSNVGGRLGARLRDFAIHSFIIQGRAEHPVILYVRKKGVEIRDATSLWGLDTVATQAALEKELGDRRVTSIVIGPAGENKIPFACLITDADHAAGRTGMGAVMGSKNLKAIVFAKPPPKTPKPLTPAARQAVDHYVGLIKSSPEYKTFRQYGGAGYITWADEMGIMPTRNFQKTRFEGVEQLDGRRLEIHKVRSRGCSRCAIQCKAELKMKAGKFAGQRLHRPEFESLMVLGAKCGLDDAEAVTYLDNLCSRLGMDILSAGSMIAFAMDLFERGIINRDDTNGLPLTWGDTAAMETLLRQMAHNEGFGKILGKGVKAAAETIGGNAVELAPHVKGLEVTAYHPENLLGAALGYMVSSRGGDYVYASMEYRWSPEKAQAELGSPLAVNRHSAEAKGILVRRAILVNIVLDSLGLCRVPALTCIGDFDLRHEADLAAAITGLPIAANALFLAADRIAALERLFNLRQGLFAEEDRLPPLFFIKEGQKLTLERMNQMLAEFYDVMGWGRGGRPTPEKLEALGIVNRSASV